MNITIPEMIGALGFDFFIECFNEGRRIRQLCWDENVAVSVPIPRASEDPPPELILSVAIGKLKAQFLEQRLDVAGMRDMFQKKPT